MYVCMWVCLWARGWPVPLIAIFHKLFTYTCKLGVCVYIYVYALTETSFYCSNNHRSHSLMLTYLFVCCCVVAIVLSDDNYVKFMCFCIENKTWFYTQMSEMWKPHKNISYYTHTHTHIHIHMCVYFEFKSCLKLLVAAEHWIYTCMHIYAHLYILHVKTYVYMCV